RLQRNQQPARHLESVSQTRFQSNHLLVNGIDPNDTDQFCNQTLFAVLWFEAVARTKVKNDRLAAAQCFASRRNKLTRFQKRRDIGRFVSLCLFLLTFGAALGHLLFVFLLFALGFCKLFLDASIFLRGAFSREWYAVLADQLLHRLTIRQWINLVDFHRLLLQLALAVD